MQNHPSFFSSLPLLFPLLLSFVQADSACTVLPSNSSQDLSWTDHRRFILQSDLHLSAGVTLAPLTGELVNQSYSQLSKFDVDGNLINVDATTLSLSSTDVALISCDASAYPGELDAAATVANLLTAQSKASAVLLYSSSANHCIYTADDDALRQYANVFTFVNSSLAVEVKDSLSSDRNRSTAIVADMSFVPNSNQGSSGGGGGGGGDSPNTAMIILYTITGIITALFLGIIITGAVRAHRHPERYGPRYTTGRPRQSRARGIARAMLETIPVVKFGDDNNVNAKEDVIKGDEELAMSSQEQIAEHPERREPTAETPAEQIRSEPKDQPSNPTSGTNTPAPAESGNYSCPICTDDFVKGQDIRVLPCNHQFHPECVDPWLVNVSGTCPLCRIDLHPAQPEENEEGTNTTDGNTETPSTGTAQPESDAPTRQHNRLSSYLHGTLNARRMRDASVEERLAALRSVREEADRENASVDAEERLRRRSRLTQRLRDRFRIRTRPHES